MLPTNGLAPLPSPSTHPKSSKRNLPRHPLGRAILSNLPTSKGSRIGSRWVRAIHRLSHISPWNPPKEGRIDLGAPPSHRMQPILSRWSTQPHYVSHRSCPWLWRDRSRRSRNRANRRNPGKTIPAQRIRILFQAKASRATRPHLQSPSEAPRQPSTSRRRLSPDRPQFPPPSGSPIRLVPQGRFLPTWAYFHPGWTGYPPSDAKIWSPV